MYSNIKQNIAIEYDEDSVSKIRKMIEESFEKLKSFVKSKKLSKFDVFRDLDQKFDDIANSIRCIDFF